ncbi:DUF6243 family protein [Streptomyces sp. NPDC051561]|uniref:DUF6243 family protein n=1 Tax=Streptomyces sp. NPDC051561 TaxID=3365658 RepID=UPI0037B57A5C
MAKSRNNLLNIGGNRRKLSRAEKQDNGPHRNADRASVAGQKQELLRKMRERAGTAEGADSAAESTDAQA